MKTTYVQRPIKKGDLIVCRCVKSQAIHNRYCHTNDTMFKFHCFLIIEDFNFGHLNHIYNNVSTHRGDLVLDADDCYEVL